MNTCPACTALRSLGVSCNAHRKGESATAFDRANAAAARAYLAKGSTLSAEEIAEFDAQAQG